MFRIFCTLLLSSGLLIGAISTGHTQDAKPAKKAQPPKPPRIAIDDPAKLKDDADFAVQGEYEGTIEGDKAGVQVIARGSGNFEAVFLRGGLPGAGYDGKNRMKVAIATVDGKPTGQMDGEKKVSVTLADGKLIIAGSGRSTEFKKVERTSPTVGANPPEGAVVLFGKPGDESNWNNGKIIELSDGKFLNYGIKTKQTFGAFRAHVEFRLPFMPNSTGQQRGNSGFYLQDRYELQVLDSFGLTGENNECGGIYTLHKPSVNMCLPPMVWQTYDIDFTPAAFGDDGKKTANARVSIKHNGVMIHDNVELKNATGGGQPENAKPAPIQLQNHGDPLVYRNIWIVPNPKS